MQAKLKILAILAASLDLLKLRKDESFTPTLGCLSKPYTTIICIEKSFIIDSEVISRRQTACPRLTSQSHVDAV